MVTLNQAFLFFVSILFQVIGLSVLPQTRGFTNIGPTIICVVTFIVGIGMFARILTTGVQLSTLIPIAAAAVPLAIVAVGLLVYGEPASLYRVLLLVIACGAIGVASIL